MASKTDKTPNTPDVDAPPARQAGFGGFLRDVLIVLVLGGAAVYWYLGYTETQEEIAKRTLDARTEMNRHDLKSLQDAEKLYREILTLEAGHAPSAAGLARTLYYQHEHGLDTLGEAKSMLQQARSGEAETPSRYAAEGFLMVADGQAERAVAQVKEWLEGGRAAPPVAHALAVAHLANGDYIESNRVARQAKEADFSNIAVRLTMAESSQRNGQDREAIKDLSAVVRNNANAEHFLAKAWLAALRAKNYGVLDRPLSLLNELNELKEKQPDRIGPRTKTFITWGEGELSLAVGNAEGAIEKADAALKELPNFAPLLDLKARSFVALGKNDEAMAAYDAAVAVKPTYRGIKWDYARLKSKQGDDEALALVEDLEKTDPAKYKGPDYLVFKAEHALNKGNLEEAMELFKAAAEEGDSADILFGIAKVTFLEEKENGKKADIEKVTLAFQDALNKKKRYPELHEYLAGVNLWNYLVEGAHGSLSQAESQYKALKKPIPEIVAFYDRAIATFENAEPKVRREASKFAEEWKQKKQEFLGSLQSS
ncbi:MAG: hypothetical protein AAGD10_11850 [Myxococcota bacterium]